MAASSVRARVVEGDRRIGRVENPEKQKGSRDLTRLIAVSVGLDRLLGCVGGRLEHIGGIARALSLAGSIRPALRRSRPQREKHHLTTIMQNTK
jgi:hypothetical protein